MYFCASWSAEPEKMVMFVWVWTAFLPLRCQSLVPAGAGLGLFCCKRLLRPAHILKFADLLLFGGGEVLGQVNFHGSVQVAAGLWFF